MGGCRVRIETAASWVTLGGCFCRLTWGGGQGWTLIAPLVVGGGQFSALIFLALWFRLGRNRFVNSQEGQDDPGEGGWCFKLQMVRSTFELNQPSAGD